MRAPSNGNRSSRYGWRGEGVTRNFHHGLDIGWSAGRTLVAPEDGEITHYGVVPGWRLGNVQIIQGVSGYEHWLCHTDYSLRGLGAVREGQPSSVMGDSGAVPGQVHVHWETRLNGARLDPEAWLARPSTTTEREDAEMMRVKSDKTGNWYVIDAMAPITRILAGPNGSANHKRAAAYSEAYGRDFIEMSSDGIQSLMQDNAARRAEFYTASGLTEQLEAVQQSLADLLAGERG